MRPPPEAIAQQEASIDIAAPPSTVYRLVSDITRMGEWSPEATGGEWRDGATGAVGDWFDGHNRAGEREWSRPCQVAEAEPGRAFTFAVLGIEADCTWWSYELEPLDGGDHTRLTERWWIVNKTPAMQEATPEQFEARVALTAEMLRATLAEVKRTAEAPA